jgi:hypothetical protein
MTHCECDRPECPSCGPLIALAAQIHDDFEHAAREAPVPTPEIIWWRAQVRARERAARTVVTPIVLAEAIGVAAAAGLLLAFADRAALPSLSWLSLHNGPLDLPVLALGLAAGCWAVVAPLLLYFAFASE